MELVVLCFERAAVLFSSLLKNAVWKASQNVFTDKPVPGHLGLALGNTMFPEQCRTILFSSKSTDAEIGGELWPTFQGLLSEV